MKPALGYKWYDPIHAWQEFPHGETLQKLEQDVINQRLALCFGNHLLKLGSLASAIQTRESLINHQVCMSNKSSANIGLVGELDDLPLMNNCVDAAIMTHVIEYSADPHQSLREAHRILMPNGNLILSVFNPLSLLLLGKLWPIKSKKSFWRGRMFTINRIKDWLSLLGFEVIDETYVCYSTLLTQNGAEQPSKLKRWMANMVPKLGSVCIITAKKREWPITPIRPRMRYKTVFQPAIRSASMVERQN